MLSLKAKGELQTKLFWNNFGLETYLSLINFEIYTILDQTYQKVHIQMQKNWGMITALKTFKYVYADNAYFWIYKNL